MRRAPGPPAMAAALLVSALAGCAPGGGTAPTAPDPPAGLSARLVQYRDDVIRRVLSVQLATAERLEVQAVRVETPAFQPAAPGAGTALTPGLPVDVRVPYGAARCEAASSAAVAVVELADGREVRLALPEAPALLGRLHAAECAQRRLGESLEITLDRFAETAPGGGALRGTLRLRRLAGASSYRVVEIGPSTLITLTGGPPGGPVLALRPGDGAAQVPVDARPGRCEPHALSESKRSTVFRVFVAVDEAPPLLVLLEPPPADRERLVRFVEQRCRARG